MIQPQINYLAVLVAALAAMAIGFVYYSPMVVGKQWMALMGWNKKDMEKNADRAKMGKMYSLSMIGSLVMAYVLAHFVAYIGANTIGLGLQIGFWSWLGFVAPVQMTDVLFGGKPWKLFAINTGYQLASLLAMGAILAAWA